MRRLVERIGFILLGGAIASAGFLLFAYPHIRDKWRMIGYNSGRLRADVDTFRRLSKHFEEKHNDCKYLDTAVTAKPEDLIIVDCGFFKTIQPFDEELNRPSP